MRVCLRLRKRQKTSSKKAAREQQKLAQPNTVHSRGWVEGVLDAELW